MWAALLLTENGFTLMNVHVFTGTCERKTVTNIILAQRHSQKAVLQQFVLISLQAHGAGEGRRRTEGADHRASLPPPPPQQQ